MENGDQPQPISNFSEFFKEEFPERSRNRSYAIFITAKFIDWLDGKGYIIVKK